MKPKKLLGLLLSGSMTADRCHTGGSGAPGFDMTGKNNKGVNNN